MLAEFDDTDDIETNGVIAARDKRNGTYYRARILGADFDEATDSLLYSVFYIDYGHTGLCKLTEMRRLLNYEMQNLPPRCFECRLAEVQPAIIQSETNDWSQEANDKFRDMIDDADQRVTAEVSHIIMHSVFTHSTAYVFTARKRCLSTSFEAIAIVFCTQKTEHRTNGWSILIHHPLNFSISFSFSCRFIPL